MPGRQNFGAYYTRRAPYILQLSPQRLPHNPLLPYPNTLLLSLTIPLTLFAGTGDYCLPHYKDTTFLHPQTVYIVVHSLPRTNLPPSLIPRSVPAHPQAEAPIPTHKIVSYAENPCATRTHACFVTENIIISDKNQIVNPLLLDDFKVS